MIYQVQDTRDGFRLKTYESNGRMLGDAIELEGSHTPLAEAYGLLERASHYRPHQGSRSELIAGPEDGGMNSRSSTKINSDLRGLLQELWDDCYRNDQTNYHRHRMFDERLSSLTHDAILGVDR